MVSRVGCLPQHRRPHPRPHGTVLPVDDGVDSEARATCPLWNGNDCPEQQIRDAELRKFGLVIGFHEGAPRILKNLWTQLIDVRKRCIESLQEG